MSPPPPEPGERSVDGAPSAPALLKALLRTALDCIICIDDDGLVREWNPASERTFGWRRDEVIGVRLSELIIPAEHRLGHEQGMAHLKRTGEGPVLGKRIEMPALTREGERIMVELAIAASQDEQGAFYTATLRDITERAAAERAVKAARDEAEDASRAKSRFLAVMSHEFRTPLHAILGMSELMRSTTLTEQQVELLETIDTSAAGMVALGDDILQQSRLDVARLEWTPSFLDVVVEVLACAEALSPAANRKSLELRCHVGDFENVEVNVDGPRLRQVLTNLVSNAIKYTRRGRVDVRLDLFDPGEGGLQIEVQDTGPGIAEAERERIFERFYRGDAPTGVGGVGLGLSVARALTEMMGGSLDVDSEPGQGSRFRLRLPAQTRPARQERFAALPDAAPVVLWVSRPFDDTLRRYLSRWGCSVTISAGEGAEALHAAMAPDSTGRAKALVVELDNEDRLDALAGRLLATGAVTEQSAVVLVAPFGVGRPSTLPTNWSVVRKPLRPERLRAALSSREAAQVVAPTTPRAPGSAPRSVGASRERPANILIAEDTPENQRLLRTILEKAGHQVTLVPDGRAAVEQAAARCFDLVLMDIEMPLLDGIDATAEIRAAESAGRRERTPIVAVTAHAVEGFRRRCVEVGMDHFVAKPVSARTLRQTVDRFADRRPIVLIADDFEPSRRLLDRAIAGSGQYRRIIAHDGEEAVALAARGTLAAAVLDLEMPGRDGWQTAEALRKMHADAVLIALSGHAGEDVAERCEAAGFDHVRHKPVAPSVLLNLLADALATTAEVGPAAAVPQGDTDEDEAKRADVARGSLTSGIPPIVRDLVPGFLGRTAALVPQAREWTAAGAFTDLVRTGHNLKGTSGGYGLHPLGEVGAQLEQAARNEDAQAIHSLLDEVQRLVERARAELEEAS